MYPDRASMNDIARDLVLLELPQPGPTELRVSLGDIMREYELEQDDLEQLFSDKDFQNIFRRESELAEGYGTDAGHVYAARDKVVDFGARLHLKMVSTMADAELKDQLKYYTILLQAAGQLEPRKIDPPAAEGDGSRITVQVINIPQLDNPKLRHLTGPLLDNS